MAEIVHISVRELCEKMLPSGNIDMRRCALRVVESVRLHKKLQKQGGAVYAPEVTLKKLFELENGSIVLNGRADGIIQTESGYILEEIKCVNVPPAQLCGEPCKTHLAQAMCYAYLYADEKELDNIIVRMTYSDISTEETISFEYTYEREDLEVFVQNLLSEYLDTLREKLERRLKFEKSAKKLAFPYESYRDGQRQFAEYALEAICTKKKLFAEAPTGIGKTMSALFPAVKAAGNGYGEKIFYFTSKTTIANAAGDAFRLLCEKGLDASCIIISARDRACQSGLEECDPTACRNACGHYDRINGALREALENERLFDFEILQQYAIRHKVCPYELSLAVSEWCELVICDYNYLFDPMVFLRRYFTQGGDYIFLIDESHNLAQRARDMYSYSIKSRDLNELLLNHSSGEKILFPKLYEVFEYMNSAKNFIEINTRREGELGVFKSTKPFGKLNTKLEELIEAFELYFRDKSELPKRMTALYFEIKKYLKIAEYYDEKYLSLIEYRNGEYTFRQVCIDPSGVIKDRLSCGRAAIFFSATLSPCDYYKSVLGGEDKDLTLVLDSPFPKENLCLAATYKFSTRLDDRHATASALADMLYTLISSKDGNYIAFFPSYKYMSEIHTAFLKKYPSVKTIIQKSDMSQRERDDYIKSFDKGTQGIDMASFETKPAKEKRLDLAGLGLVRGSEFFGSITSQSPKSADEEKTQSMLAFGVLGGVFSEGIDYSGEKLIGCAIVGVGLPSINDDSNMICDYYNQRSDDEYMRGYDYAYRIPGMTKVLQAAGRVIRSESDRGVILLIDDRYQTREYASMYPSHWKHMKLIGDKRSLKAMLDRFWRENE